MGLYCAEEDSRCRSWARHHHAGKGVEASVVESWRTGREQIVAGVSAAAGTPGDADTVDVHLSCVTSELEGEHCMVGAAAPHARHSQLRCTAWLLTAAEPLQVLIILHSTSRRSPASSAATTHG